MTEREQERSQVVFEGFTRGQLEDAFNAVANQENWKLPVDARVPVGQFTCEQVHAAVVFFAGCVPTFKVEKNPEDAGYHWRVRAVGYYAAVGA